MVELEKIVYQALDYIKKVCPVDTGNMRQNIKVIKSSKNEWQIRIGGDVVPYAVYTNEKWVSPRWKGRKNPNEKWIDDAVGQIAQITAKNLRGDLTFNEKEVEDRRANKNYWDSPEGQQKLKEYRLNDTA